MRRILLPFLLLSALSAAAQDPAFTATQAAQQANQTAMQVSQQASDDALRANQQASQNAMLFDSSQPRAATPKISVQTGTYSAPVTAEITASGKHAQIYYTTDGWTPTIRSRRYDGPITIDHTAKLQAIAIVPKLGRSRVAEASYTLPGAPRSLVVHAAADGMLRQGTSIPLLFASGLNSKTAHVGDHFTLKLASEVRVGPQVIPASDCEAFGTVTGVRHATVGGIPGSIVFRLDSLRVKGIEMPLEGSETAEAQDRQKKVNQVIAIPFAVFFVHGNDALIAPQTQVMATIKADTQIPAE